MKKMKLTPLGFTMLTAAALFFLSAGSLSAQTQNNNRREATRAISTRSAHSVKTQPSHTSPAEAKAKDAKTNAAASKVAAPRDPNKSRRLHKHYDDSKTNRTSKNKILHLNH
jgi:hypothetical protein